MNEFGFQTTVLSTIESFIAKGHSSITSTTIAGVVGQRSDVVETALDALYATDKVIRHGKGWGLPAADTSRLRTAIGLTPELTRLAAAIFNASPDVTFSELSRRARIERKRLRSKIEELISRSIIRERADGWYE